MSVKDNKKISLFLFEEVWNKGNIDMVEKIVAPDFVLHESNRDIIGIPNYKKYILGYRRAFPDVHFIVEDLLADGDKVVERWTAQGTHKGELYGIPATSKKVKISGIDIVHISNGKMIERWGCGDILGVLQQIGIVSLI